MKAIIAISILVQSTVFAGTFECSKWTQKERQVVKPRACDDQRSLKLLAPQIVSRPEFKDLFANTTEEQVAADEHLKNIALEAKYRTTSNMNGAVFKFPSGVERVVFRGSYHAPMFTDESVLKKQGAEKDLKRACMKNLVSRYSLNKIINYDELDWKSAIQLTGEEKHLFLELNPAGQYWEFTPAQNGRTFQYKFKKVGKKQVMNDVAFIIKEIEGAKTQPGSAYIHCYGGHHRTGAVWGVLQKCIGKMDVESVIAEYKCHISYESPEQPGLYHADNEALIREFPCAEYFGN